MNNKQEEKPPKAIPKPFMAVGPTLHYSHKNVQRCWLLALSAFCISAFFFSKIQTGLLWSFSFEAITSCQYWHLGRFFTVGLSIFEYPWQIVVLGLLMGILAVTPLLISQLMSFWYSFPFVLAVFFLASLPGLAVSLLVSCVAVACRPLRFRSRFISVALCTAPQIIYWGCFAGAGGVEPVKWGFSFTPWICAWLVGLSITGVVLGIGHFTRYRPGLVWIVTSMVLLTAVILFEITIGFDELDYQLYVAKNNPEDIVEFRDTSITEALDKLITDPSVEVRRHIASSFYSTEPIPLRAKLKEKIGSALNLDRWPSWFVVPQELGYQQKKHWLGKQLDFFISHRPQSRRMPIALYYRALLSEYSLDIKTFEEKELLHFYSDYPHERSRDIWYWLYTEFGDSAESLEARWRMAKHWAGRMKFDQADKLLANAQEKLVERLKQSQKQSAPADTFFSVFRGPVDSAMTRFKLAELQRKVNHLRNLISAENRIDDPESAECLAKFVMLNPHACNYERHLDELLAQMGDNDPLRDNILLAQIKLIADEQLRAEKLSELHEKFQNTDGGMQALYELGLLKRRLWSQYDQTNAEQKKKYLAETREILERFISLYPDSFCAEQARENLDNLPTVD